MDALVRLLLSSNPSHALLGDFIVNDPMVLGHESAGIVHSGAYLETPLFLSNRP